MNGFVLVMVLLLGDGTTNTIQIPSFTSVDACDVAKNNIENQIMESRGSKYESMVPEILSQGCYSQSSYK